MWLFIQDQVLGMHWLNNLVGMGLSAIGIDLESKIGGSLQFFIYDVIKIFVLLCTLIFVISYIQSYFPPERTKRILGRFRGLPANVLSALLGTITPFCSCSSIPLFIGFTRAGLPVGVTFSFLISSPMVDLGSLVILTSIFGFEIALWYVILGLVIAVIGGTILDKLNMERYVADFIKEQVARDMAKSHDISATSLHQDADDKQDAAQVQNLKNNEENTSFTKRSVKSRIDEAWGQVKFTFNKVWIFVLIGVAIGAGIHNYIPQEWVVTLLGDKNPFGVVLATLAGIPMYADIFGTIPIAEALLAQGAQLGVVLSFMMAVTTLSLPALIMLRQVLKMPLLASFVGICTLGIVIVGYVFNSMMSFLV